ncbi:MAG: hypothetical protein SWH54_05220 [Thermodesulfobacteriota bacterium]|nr:hypothetical protein [Thermodesulfobacteriota bacterium]
MIRFCALDEMGVQASPSATPGKQLVSQNRRPLSPIFLYLTGPPD